MSEEGEMRGRDGPLETSLCVEAGEPGDYWSAAVRRHAQMGIPNFTHSSGT